MPDNRLKEYLQPYPGIRDFIFAPPEAGETRTWIFGADGTPQTIINFHFSSFLMNGWRVVRDSPSLVAERAGAGVSVSVSVRGSETRVVYEIHRAPNG